MSPNSRAVPSVPTGAPARSGGSDCLMEEFPPRPRGMHWATYRRLEAQEVAADEQWTVGVMDLLARVGKRRP